MSTSPVRQNDYQDLRQQINDFEHTFYGPHGCDLCGVQIVKMATDQGGHAYDLPPDGSKYSPHVCKGPVKDSLAGYMHMDAVNYNVRHLAGRILTFVDAVFSISEQRKAAKDLVKQEFKRTLDTMWAVAHRVDRGDAQSTIEPLQSID